MGKGIFLRSFTIVANSKPLSSNFISFLMHEPKAGNSLALEMGCIVENKLGRRYNGGGVDRIKDIDQTSTLLGDSL